MHDDTPLSILILGIKWPPETFLQRLFDGLLERGLRLTVATTDKPDAAWLNRPNFDWVYMPSLEGPIWRRAGNLARYGVRNRPAMLWRALRTFGPRQLYRVLPLLDRSWDMIYCPWNSAATGYKAAIQLLDIPFVVSCRGAQVSIAPHNPSRTQMRDWLADTLDAAAAIHCVSDAIRQDAQQFADILDKSVVIRPAVNPAMFTLKQYGERAEDAPVRIVTTGSLIWRKGYEYALLAMRKLVDQHNNVQFDIIGDGPERQRLLFTIDDLQLNGHVTLLGRLAPQTVAAKLQAADIFLLSSLSEGISNAVLEAMACGLPVVTTDCGGMREAVTDGVEGFVVPLRDAARMADRLQLLATRPALRRKMGVAARQRIVADFDLRDQVSQFAALFNQVKQAKRRDR